VDNTVDGVPSDLEDPLHIEVDERGTDGVLLTLRGELDPHTAPRLKERIDDALASNRADLTLDLAGVTFIDSSGLRVILSGHKEANERGGRLVLQSPSPTARRLLDITGLLDHIDVDG
jgi:anti-anti-sigma factor